LTYCTEDDVYAYSGTSSNLIVSVTGKTAAQVTTLIEDYIAKADRRIKQWVRVPIILHRELHLGDGEKRIFELGPSDEDMDLYDYDPQKGVEKVFAAYIGKERLHMPYPKDCNGHTNLTASSFGSSGITPTDTANSVATRQVGTYHISGTFGVGGGWLQYPSTAYLMKNIDIYKYASFILQSSSVSPTFTFSLYDIDGNANTRTFQLQVAGVRTFVSINIDQMSGTVEWEDTLFGAWRLASNSACSIELDGFSLNQGLAWGYPYGELYYTRCETYSVREGDEGVPSDGYQFRVTYSFDPFDAEYYREGAYPPYVVSASARLAGAFLWDYLQGYTLADSKIRVSGETLEPLPPKDVMLQMKRRLIREAKEDVAGYGYGHVGGVF